MERAVGQADEVAVDGFRRRLHAADDEGSEAARFDAAAALALLQSHLHFGGTGPPREVAFRGKTLAGFEHKATVAVVEHEDDGALEEAGLVDFEGHAAAGDEAAPRVDHKRGGGFEIIGHFAGDGFAQHADGVVGQPHLLQSLRVIPVKALGEFPAVDERLDDADELFKTARFAECGGVVEQHVLGLRRDFVRALGPLHGGGRVAAFARDVAREDEGHPRFPLLAELHERLLFFRIVLGRREAKADAERSLRVRVEREHGVERGGFGGGVADGVADLREVEKALGILRHLHGVRLDDAARLLELAGHAVRGGEAEDGAAIRGLQGVRALERLEAEFRCEALLQKVLTLLEEFLGIVDDLLELLRDHFRKGLRIDERRGLGVVRVAQELDDGAELGETFEGGAVVGHDGERLLESGERLVALAAHGVHDAEVVPDRGDAGRLLGGLAKERDGVIFAPLQPRDGAAMKQRERSAWMAFLEPREQLAGLGGFGVLDGVGERIEMLRGAVKGLPRLGQFRAHRADGAEHVLDLERIAVRDGGIDIRGPRDAVREAEKIEFPRGRIDPAEWGGEGGGHRRFYLEGLRHAKAVSS